jgi:acetyl esterase/lipase
VTEEETSLVSVLDVWPGQVPDDYGAIGGETFRVVMYLALKRAGVPAELHVYAAGGHSFAVRPSGRPVSTWPERCAAWLRTQGC